MAASGLDVVADFFAPVQSGVVIYHDRPADFVKECIRWERGEKPAPYQLRNLETLVKHGRVAVRAPRGAGKTASNAWTILWFALTREAAGEDWMVVVTAKVYRQLIEFLWGQLRTRWVTRLDWETIGREPFVPNIEMMLKQLRLKHGSVILAATADSAKIEGAHADELLFIFDEAWSIPDSIYDALQGALLGAGRDTRANAYVLVTSTPFVPEGRFYDLCEGKHGGGRYIGVHVTLQEALAAGQVSEDGVQEYVDLYGEDSAIYANHVLGEFARQGVDSVIRYEHLLEAHERWEALELPTQQGLVVPIHESLGPLEIIGADIAGKGGDHSCFALRHGRIISAVLVRPHQADTTVTRGELEALARFPERRARIVIDALNAGESMANELRANGHGIVDFVASNKTDLRTRGGQMGFDRMRSAAWWNLREMLEPGSGFDLAIPPDEQLTADLLAPRWEEASGGKVAVEQKASIKKRLKRSTDAGDSVVQSYFLSRIAPTVSAPRILRRPGGSPTAPLRQRAGGGVGFGRRPA
jgi:hypothetical protein